MLVSSSVPGYELYVVVEGNIVGVESENLGSRNGSVDRCPGQIPSHAEEHLRQRHFEAFLGECERNKNQN